MTFSRRSGWSGFSARLATHLRHVLNLTGQVLIEDYLVEDGPQADTLLTNDLNQPSASMLTGRILAHLLLEELQSALVHVIPETSHASMPEQLDFVVEFDDLRVLFLAELIAILLIHVKFLPILIVVIIVIVVLIKEGIVIIFLTIEVWSLHQVLIIIAHILHAIVLRHLELLHSFIDLVVVKTGLDVEDAATLA